MTLLVSMAAIVTIMLFVIFRDYLPALVRLEQKQTEKEKACGYAVEHDVPKPDWKSKENTKKMRPGLRSANSLPKHKRDPRIFVDSEEIGDEPYS